MSRCHWCTRDTSEGDYVNVSLADGRIVRCCSVCWSRQDVEIPLDYTVDEFQNREGLPEFNGAFR